MVQKPMKDNVMELHWPTQRGRSAYELFMEEENLPIYGGLGIYDSRQLPLKPWKRMGGKGTYIELDGQAGYFGMYVVEIPAGGVLNPERHFYEETLFAIEGRGSTEIWQDGSSKKQTFEWQGGAFFAPPLNVWHRLVNATSNPVLIVGTTSAPTVMDMFPNREFIFENPFQFRDRYDGGDDFFKSKDEAQPREEGSPFWDLRTNLVPDVATCMVPQLNRRAPGQGNVGVRMAGNTYLTNGIFDYPSGRYSTGHCHAAGRVLVCLKGKGYSLNWDSRLGKRPWESGNGHLVNRQDYIPGGFVTAAPGSGDWFHQHFSTAKESLRTMRLGTHGELREGPGEEIEMAGGGVFLGPGRHEVTYSEEDPQVRKDYMEALKKEGAEFTMPEEIYRTHTKSRYTLEREQGIR
ncbi:MAG: cupin domain-containing protein [Dehalococcoidales bacterium]|nr:cupin domain-containing protein [Dehalococcoidales bacterium]